MKIIDGYLLVALAASMALNRAALISESFMSFSTAVFNAARSKGRGKAGSCVPERKTVGVRFRQTAEVSPQTNVSNVFKITREE